MLSETIRDRYERTALTEGIQLTVSQEIDNNILILYWFLFIHYEPLWSSSCGFGAGYPRQRVDFKKLPDPSNTCQRRN